MFSIKINGVVENVKSSTFEGKTINKVQFSLIDEKQGLQVKEVKLLETQKIENIKIGSNIEMEVKLFSSQDKKDIYFSQNSEIKILK